MQVVGIVAEYNPFHTGHAYQIARTRAELGEDAPVVAVMSGCWVQGYLDRASVDVSVRRRNAAFQLGAATETLQPEDYRWAENVLCFLKPCWWQLHEDHRALENVLLKTHLLAQR